MKKRETDSFSEETIRKKRTFPKVNTVFLVLLVLFQVVCIVGALLYTPVPQDEIEYFGVSVLPKDDGSLDITYDIHWRALDTEEPLTFVTVGVANNNVGIYRDTVSEIIRSYTLETDGEYSVIRFDFVTPYIGGDEVRFTFTINQRDMLLSDLHGYFYEFIPGWFNRIPIERYEFRWAYSEGSRAPDAQKEGDTYLWQGSLGCGGYVPMRVYYEEAAFAGCHTSPYRPFDDEGAYDELEGDKTAAIFLAIVLCLAAAVGQLFIIDSYVSYHKGRGFLSGYGHRVHVYGRVNPHYSAARARHSGSRGGGGGGCACACACACAGGGRAGCSQKDTYHSPEEE